MEVMKMAAGDDYKDDDDDDGHGGGGGGGDYSPTNRSEHSYELYVGEGAERQAAGSLQPHRRMSVFTEEDEEEAALAAAAMGAEQQEGRDRRVSQCHAKDAQSQTGCSERRTIDVFAYPSYQPRRSSLAPSWKWNPHPRVRVRSCAHPSAIGPNYIFMPLFQIRL